MEAEALELENLRRHVRGALCVVRAGAEAELRAIPRDGVHGDDVLFQHAGVRAGDVIDAGAGVLGAEQDTDRANEVMDLEVVPALLARAEGDSFVAESGAKHGVHEARFMVAAAVHAVDAHVDELHRRVVVDFREEALLGRPTAETELRLSVGAHRHGHAMIADAVLGLGAGEEELPRTEQLRVEVGLLRVLDILDLDVRVAAARGADTIPREVDPRVDEGRWIEAQHLRVVRFAELGFRKLTQVEVDGPVRRVRADAMRIELLHAPAARAHRADDLMALPKQKLRCIQSQKAGDPRDKHSHDDFSFLLLSWFFAEPGKF